MPASTVPSTEQVPTKEKSRKYLQTRFKAATPPPSRDEIRMQMGWAMLEDELDAVTRAAQKR